MRKLVLLAIILINFSVLPSLGADNVIIDRITQKEAEELDLTIPEDVPAGFHSIEIEVYDDAGTVSKKEIPFCKNLDGEIHWDNLCPDVLEAKEIAKLDLVKDPEQLKPYAAKAALHPGGAVDLSVGSPVDPTPSIIQDALNASSNAPGYPSTGGSAEFKAAVEAA